MADGDGRRASYKECIDEDVNLISFFGDCIVRAFIRSLAIPWEDGVIRHFLLFIYPFIWLSWFCMYSFWMENKLGWVRCFIVRTHVAHVRVCCCVIFVKCLANYINSEPMCVRNLIGKHGNGRQQTGTMRNSPFFISPSARHIQLMRTCRQFCAGQNQNEENRRRNSKLLNELSHWTRQMSLRAHRAYKTASIWIRGGQLIPARSFVVYLFAF